MTREKHPHAAQTVSVSRHSRTPPHPLEHRNLAVRTRGARCPAPAGSARRAEGACPVWLATLALLCLAAGDAYAVRPFVTDDARIIDVGQAEMETWLEVGRGHGEWDPLPALNMMGGYTINDWIEIIVGSGFGRGSDDRFAIANPVLQPKLLFTKAEVNGRPGHAMGIGMTFDTGAGTMHNRGSNYYIIGITTYRLLDDDLNIHLNYGTRIDRERGGPQRVQPYWGLGFEIQTPVKDLRYIIEGYAGDPLELNDPKWAGQTGLRWLKSDYFNMDLTVGAMPQLDQRRRQTGSFEGWVQLGLRFLFDVDTPGGRPGRFDGADGMFKR